MENFLCGDRKINGNEDREPKWDNFDKFVNIVREYVENEYYGGFECKIEKGKIVDSKDWRKRKLSENNNQK